MTPGGSPRPIRAAGGVVWRVRSEVTEVLVVHRPRHGDWSLPKGKLDRDERHKDAALREVAEETGVLCVLGPSLGSVAYDTPEGPKRVKWWAMTPVDGVGDAPGADDPTEVDAVEWVALAEAQARLTHDSDRQVLSRLTPALPA